MAEEDPFAAAYRAYLEAVKAAWADVDVEALVSARPPTFDEKVGYSSAGSVSTVGTFACVGTLGGCFGSAGTIGSIYLQPEQSDSSE